VSKFKFSYETLIRFRETRLLLAKKEMFVVEAEIRQISDEISKCLSNRKTLIEESQDTASKNVDQIQLAADLVESQSKKIKILTHRLLSAEKELDRHKNWVAHLGRELKIIEKLKEKQKEKFEHENRLRETKTADGWVSQDWVQKMIQSETENQDKERNR
jgi:flagellar export protein FliJ